MKNLKTISTFAKIEILLTIVVIAIIAWLNISKTEITENIYWLHMLAIIFTIFIGTISGIIIAVKNKKFSTLLVSIICGGLLMLVRHLDVTYGYVEIYEDLQMKNCPPGLIYNVAQGTCERK